MKHKAKKSLSLSDADGDLRKLTRADFRRARLLREADPALAEWALQRSTAKKVKP